jgi:hypothetical protein
VPDESGTSAHESQPRHRHLAVDLLDSSPPGRKRRRSASDEILEDCNVPDRLLQWQWVDYIRNDGYCRLVRALLRQASLPG